MSLKLAIDSYKNYGTYVNAEKMLPSIIDGLIPVQRRILLVLHQIASKSHVKTVTANGKLIGEYHPHGESIGPASWAVSNNFAIGGGLWGNKIGIEPTRPAAARYTTIKAHPFVESTAMKYIKHVNWDLNELEYSEPDYLPTLYPFCLMGQNEFLSIGFGLKSEIPVYKKSSLHKRLLYLLGKEKNIIIKPNIPNCDIISNKSELKNLLLNGEAQLTVKGKYKEDIKNKCIYIYGWSPRIIDFKSIYNKIIKYDEMLNLDNIGFIDESDEKGTKIKFEVLRQRNTSEIYNKMKEAIDNALISNIRYCIYVVDTNGKFKIASVDEMLLECHKHYKEVYKKYCNHTINKYNETIKEMNIIQKLKPIISEIDLKYDFDKIINKLAISIKENEDDVKSVINKYSISSLLKFKVDKKDIEDKMNEMIKITKTIDSYILKEYSNASN